MSLLVAPGAGEQQSQQPFQCPDCRTRFTRQENLKRHAALHTRSHEKVSFPCGFCRTTFSRRDLRLRHVKRKHPEQEDGWPPTKRIRRSPPAAPARDLDCSSSEASEDAAKTPSVSLSESQYSLLSQQWDKEMHLDLSDAAWNIELPGMDGRGQLEHDYQYRHSPGSIALSTSLPTSAEGDDVCDDVVHGRRLMAAGSTPTAAFPHGSADLDLAMSLGTSVLAYPRDDPGAQMASPSAEPLRTSSPGASPDTVMCSTNLPDGLSPRDLPYVQDDWYPSASQVIRGLDLYFAHVSHFVPFLHQPTFDATQTTPYLVLSMLCLAYQHGDDPDRGDQAGTGSSISLRCFHRARVLLATQEESDDDFAHNLKMVQANLLLEICAIMYLCGKDSAYGLKMHSRIISLARFSGLTQPTVPEVAATKDLEALWGEFIKSESHKRTLFAVHQIDALLYQFLSIPRSLSHLEIKHELPCPEGCWASPSAAEWAYQQLVTKQSTPPVQYAEAVRRILSPPGPEDDTHPNPKSSSLPAFDPYGAINIAQFLLSSAREVSGWSTMTGRLSLERLEPLRSSLVALGPCIRPPPPPCGTTASASNSSTSSSPLLAASREATWEIAMIELQIWSPSHTCGIVGGSVDAVLKESTYLASSSEILFGAETAHATQPHIDWFLRYLDATLAPESEPPWVALYAFKAFLIAWQLVRKGVAGAMSAVGVVDGDVEGAMVWAKGVFRRRERWRLGKLIMACLEVLDK
ncbi:hypothetical protein Daus18300_001261 [Diaporthe australafricana]|uniref:C2H2-type domain-containing protein n=1 Tax=Diaporthe australafricana TaxID=127596 RepID=A0ABR3XY87_9PEZI